MKYSERERQIPYDISYIWNLNDTNELIYKTETDSQTSKSNLRLPKGKVKGGIKWELTDRHYYESESEVSQLCPTLCDPMGFSKQEYWSGLPLPSPEDLPHPGIKPRSP